MKNFTYHQPTSVATALPLLDDKWGKTELLAGGTDLHDLQKEYVAQPDKVVSVTGLGGDFTKIQVSRGYPVNVTIGAGCYVGPTASLRGDWAMQVLVRPVPAAS